MADPGNRRAKAQDIGVLSGTQTFKDTLSRGDRKDFYRFSLNTSSNLKLRLKGLKANANLILLSENGDRISQSKRPGTKKEKIKETLEPGTYYAKVVYKKGDTSYKLKLKQKSTSTLSAQDQEVLDAHNRYRAEVGVPDLNWSDALERNAQSWADYLGDSGGILQHDNSLTDQGENLWRGTTGFYSPTDVVDSWGSERAFFQNGIFPNVSTTGNWADVGHYTQIVWRSTTHVGCAKVTEGGNDIWVCRYSPPGNYSGQSVL